MRNLAIIAMSVLMICWGFYYFIPISPDKIQEVAAHITVIVCGIVFLCYALSPYVGRFRSNA